MAKPCGVVVNIKELFNCESISQVYGHLHDLLSQEEYKQISITFFKLFFYSNYILASCLENFNFHAFFIRTRAWNLARNRSTFVLRPSVALGLRVDEKCSKAGQNLKKVNFRKFLALFDFFWQNLGQKTKFEMFFC